MENKTDAKDVSEEEKAEQTAIDIMRGKYPDIFRGAMSFLTCIKKQDPTVPEWTKINCDFFGLRSHPYMMRINGLTTDARLVLEIMKEKAPMLYKFDPRILHYSADSSLDTAREILQDMAKEMFLGSMLKRGFVYTHTEISDTTYAESSGDAARHSQGYHGSAWNWDELASIADELVNWELKSMKATGLEIRKVPDYKIKQKLGIDNFGSMANKPSITAEVATKNSQEKLEGLGVEMKPKVAGTGTMNKLQSMDLLSMAATPAITASNNSKEKPKNPWKRTFGITAMVARKAQEKLEDHRHEKKTFEGLY
ncbi:hypothetical protein M011DRAFT_480147 [Sporormia fimetaria CBS 119925]|uniref:Uncharacterized protein n=1 Tax=Sporormia fimetaria CBS 119925 TaxID=1340428 RepID=A0A6A6V2E2_9PLEO|nr:hypothetical protein M011DRAFT_480147 [Sporormia fimetaria CBS 119925]